MSRKNNKWLLAVMALLVVIFILTNYLRNQERKEDVVPENLFSVDSAAVSSIAIQTPGQARELITFKKTDKHWMIEKEGRSVEPNQEKIGILIQDLQRATPERLVSKSREAWEKYELTDSMCTRVTVEETGRGKVLDLFIGKFSYHQSQRNAGNQMGIEGVTYIRINEGPEVYSIDGFLGMRINQDFDAWRNTDFLKTDQAAMRSLRFEYPADSGFVVMKAPSSWLIDGNPVDSTATANYLNQIVNRPQSVFADGFHPSSEPLYRITLEGDHMQTVVLSCYADAGGQYFLHSSLNPTAYFKSGWTEILGQLFVPKRSFVLK